MRKSGESTGDIGDGLAQSLRSTKDGLSSFLASLKSARMPDAAQGYIELRNVLIQQRLWVHTHHRIELIPLFNDVALVAEEIRGVLAPYVEALSTIARLQNPVSNPATDSDPSREISAEKRPTADILESSAPAADRAQSILEAVLSHGPISTKRLEEVLDDESAGWEMHAADLVDSGILETRGRGRRTSYRLSADAVARLVRGFQTEDRR